MAKLHTDDSKIVSNGPVARLFRTIGYIALLISGIYITLIWLSIVLPDALSHLTVITDFYADYIIKYLTIEAVLLYLPFGGLLLVGVTQARGGFVKLLTALVVVFAFLVSIYNMESLAFTGIFPVGVPSLFEIEFLQTNLVFDIKILSVIFIVFTLFLWAVWTYRKPAKPSIFFLRVAALASLLVMIASTVILYVPSLSSADWLEKARYWLFTGQYALISVASVLGILGVFFK